jgi:hypothetical protein
MARAKTRTRKDRQQIPAVIAARVLFQSDRTCCVCRTRGKPVQIHHVDDDPSNSSIENLAVLCLDCHTTTQIIGGFHRKLDAEQIILYREDWVANVGRERAQSRAAIADDLLGSDTEIKLATGIADIYREANAYESLAMHYAVWGNDELRDKYIDLAIKAGMDDESIIYYRSCQGRADLIPSQVITRRERRLKSQRDFVGLGRMYRSLNRPWMPQALRVGESSRPWKREIFSPRGST